MIHRPSVLQHHARGLDEIGQFFQRPLGLILLYCCNKRDDGESERYGEGVGVVSQKEGEGGQEEKHEYEWLFELRGECVEDWEENVGGSLRSL